MWNKFPKKVKDEIIKKGIYKLKSGQHEYMITHQLIKDGRKNKVLKKLINSKIPVTMVHGSKDEVVPKIYSKKMLSLFPNARKKLKIINNGDHSLSSNKNLRIIINELNQLFKNIN